jgi:hypothetical protein
MPPELIEEGALQVADILRKEEEKRRYPDINDALALSMVQLHRPWPATVTAWDTNSTADAAKAALHS